MAANPSRNILLIARPRDKFDKSGTIEIVPGAGDGRQVVRVLAESSTVYELFDPATCKGPKDVRARRAGQSLEIFLEGSKLPDAVIESYYDETIVTAPGESLVGLNSSGNTGAYRIHEGPRPTLTKLTAEAMPIVLIQPPRFLRRL